MPRKTKRKLTPFQKALRGVASRKRFKKQPTRRLSMFGESIGKPFSEKAQLARLTKQEAREARRALIARKRDPREKLLKELKERDRKLKREKKIHKLGGIPDYGSANAPSKKRRRLF